MLKDQHIAFGLISLTTMYIFSSVIPILGIFSAVYLFIILGINMYYMFICNLIKTPNDTLIKIITVFYFLNFLGFILTADHSNSSSFGMFKSVSLVSSSFFPFYYFGLKKIDLKKAFTIFLYVALPLTILLYNQNEKEILLERISVNQNVVNNASYIFLFLSPFVFLFKNKILKNLIFLLIFTFIIESAKRGALIIFVLIFLYNIYDQVKLIRKESDFQRFKYIIIYGIAIVASYFYLSQKFLNNTFLLTRFEGLEEGNVSGRDLIFESLIENWSNAEYFIQMIVGFGFASTLRISATGNFAHNDWLELLTNFGLIGVIIYAIILFRIANIGFQQKSTVIISSFLIIISSTLFSMFYTSLNSVFIMQLIGYYIAFNRYYVKTSNVH